MSSAALANLGMLHIVTGRITYASGVPTLVCNDDSATLADTGAGIATLTFGDAFLTAPAVTATYRKGTEAATTNNLVVVDSVTTTTVVFRFKNDVAGTNATGDPADTDGCQFIAIGMRNN